MYVKNEQLQFQNNQNLTDLFVENRVTSFVPINIKSIKESELLRQASTQGEKLSKVPEICGDVDEGIKMDISY